MTRIWVPKFKIIEPKRELDAASGMKGFFKLSAKRPDGRIRPLTGWFPNLITTSGLNLIGTTGGFFGHVRVGTGTNAPNIADTALQNQVAITSNQLTALSSSGAQSTPPYYGFRIRGWEFAAGEAAGNLTEIGTGSGTGASPTGFFSRALILDESLDPTSITVLADEILQVQYQLRVYPPIEDVLDTLTIGPTTHDILTRASLVTNAAAWAFSTVATSAGIQGGPTSSNSGHQAYDGDIGAIDAGPAGTAANSSSTGSIPSYSQGSFQNTREITFAIGAGNFTPGIRCIRSRFGAGANDGFGAIQTQFTPVIPKTPSDVLTLTVRHRWARFEGYDS